MIELMPELPSHVVGLVASGQVTAEDYETVVIPAVEAALKTHDKICLLYHIGPEWTGFTAGAMWDDAKVGLSHMAAWGKVAVVTDVEWIRAGVKFFGFTITGVVKIFGNERLDEAKAWVSE